MPYDEIQATGDRSWTFRLLDRLREPGVPDEELDQLLHALTSVSDPRSVLRLEGILTARENPDRVRALAGTALRWMQHGVVEFPEETLRRWWRDGDALLREHALGCMNDFLCPDILLEIAKDPDHPLHARALGQMNFGFDRPEHEGIKRAGLGHPDPEVRASAAAVLLWDEPARAEGPLLRATEDPVPEVAVEAINTLKYYPTRRTVRCLHGLLSSPVLKVRDQARESWEELRGDFLNCLCGPNHRVVEHIRRWLHPVRDLLAYSKKELAPDEEEPGPYIRKCRIKMPVGELLALLRNPDSPVASLQRLTVLDWSAYSEQERQRLRGELLRHADPEVRGKAPDALQVWQDTEGLRFLIGDPFFVVRKHSMYALGQLPPTEGLAELAWDHLARRDARGTHAEETLATFVHHARPKDAIPRLAAIAEDDNQRENLRVAAVDHLGNLEACAVIARLAPVLLGPPAVTWSLHIAILNAFPALGLPLPDVAHLREVDHLNVQEALARAGCA